MIIDNLDKLKITSVKKDGCIVHFCYDGEHYTLVTGRMDYTLVTALYKGRCKGHLERISSSYGMIRDLIEYKSNKRVLSNIDKEHFVVELIDAELLKPTEIQKEKAKLRKINRLRDEVIRSIKCAMNYLEQIDDVLKGKQNINKKVIIYDDENIDYFTGVVTNFGISRDDICITGIKDLTRNFISDNLYCEFVVNKASKHDTIQLDETNYCIIFAIMVYYKLNGDGVSLDPI